MNGNRNGNTMNIDLSKMNLKYDSWVDRGMARQVDMDLLKAALSGDLKKVDEALKNGANPINCGYKGTPIIYSICIEGSHKIAVYLIQKFPACVFSVTKDGLTVLFAVCTKFNHEKDKKATYELVRLILEYGANINAHIGPFKNNGTILHHCCSDPTMLKILLEYKPNPFIFNIVEKTPLQYHIFFGDYLFTRKEDFEEITKMLENYEKQYSEEIETELLKTKWEKWAQEYNKAHPGAEKRGYGPGAMIPYEAPQTFLFNQFSSNEDEGWQLVSKESAQIPNENNTENDSEADWCLI